MSAVVAGILTPGTEARARQTVKSTEHLHNTEFMVDRWFHSVTISTTALQTDQRVLGIECSILKF